MSDSERSDAYVMVNDNKIKLSSIPDTQRTLITSELQSRNRPVTEQAIAQLWVSANKPN
jgi:soluble lytic murein transglycosylase